MKRSISDSELEQMLGSYMAASSGQNFQLDEGRVFGNSYAPRRILKAIIIKVVVAVITLIILSFIIFVLLDLAPSEIVDTKPVIYLYPEEPTEVTVRLNYGGELFITYPAYHDGWSVLAYPDGTLINHHDGREYSYLFWEGRNTTDYDLSKGFVVRGEDTVEFLQHTLAYIGLIPREYNEFIVYWLPYMQDNAYNLITFQGEVYTDSAELIIYPEPDSVLRVFMAIRPLSSPIEVEEQVLEPFTRTGFAVIEWGGAIIE